ncbi:MAG: phosphoribosylanthranilate isomerase [SAR202 cluster bacterium]|nr:phosphoribosylanthranilate isomerase [SAR202 cluster bacterium]
MTRFKICGLRDPHHAVVAAKSGASFLGFVFVHGVRRQLTEQQAAGIISEYRRLRGQGGPRLVGLFADQPLDEVNRIVNTCGLDYAQLCGDEPPDYWGKVAVPIIKQIKVAVPPLPSRERPLVPMSLGPKGEGDAAQAGLDAVVEHTLRRAEQVLAAGHRVLLDSYEPGHLGGTGRTFDWAVAREVAKSHEVILAGGLTPENVGRAVETVHPWAVDVSSGVETDGVKDGAKIKAFADAVHRTDQAAAKPRVG